MDRDTLELRLKNFASNFIVQNCKLRGSIHEELASQSRALLFEEYKVFLKSSNLINKQQKLRLEVLNRERKCNEAEMEKLRAHDEACKAEIEKLSESLSYDDLSMTEKEELEEIEKQLEDELEVPAPIKVQIKKEK